MKASEDIKICDVCKDKIAKGKCFMCGKDLCPNCSERSTFEMDRIVSFGFIFLCRECKTKIHNTLRLAYKDNKELFEVLSNVPSFIINEIKRIIVVEEL